MQYNKHQELKNSKFFSCNQAVTIFKVTKLKKRNCMNGSYFH